LAQLEANISYFNRILEKMITGFCKGDRQKLLDHGLNSTTRAWGMKTGMEPRNLGSQGWIEALLMFGMMNGLKVNAEVILYAVEAKVLIKRPQFSDSDSRLLSEAVPNTQGSQEKDDEQDSDDVDNNVNVLDDLLTKCYQLGYHMINR
jgi:hypothetical protein